MNKVSLVEIMSGLTSYHHLCDDIFVDENVVVHGLVIFAKGVRYTMGSALITIPDRFINDGTYYDLLKQKVFTIKKF